jgi:hypothetical protein
MVVVFGDVAHCISLERGMEIKLEENRFFTIGLIIYSVVMPFVFMCVRVCARVRANTLAMYHH